MGGKRRRLDFCVRIGYNVAVQGEDVKTEILRIRLPVEDYERLCEIRSEMSAAIRVDISESAATLAMIRRGMESYAKSRTQQ